MTPYSNLERAITWELCRKMRREHSDKPYENEPNNLLGSKKYKTFKSTGK